MSLVFWLVPLSLSLSLDHSRGLFEPSRERGLSYFSVRVREVLLIPPIRGTFRKVCSRIILEKHYLLCRGYYNLTVVVIFLVLQL